MLFKPQILSKHHHTCFCIFYKLEGLEFYFWKDYIIAQNCSTRILPLWNDYTIAYICAIRKRIAKSRLRNFVKIEILESEGSEKLHFVEYLYISTTLMWLPQENFDWNKRGDWWRQLPKWNLTLNKRWNWSSCTTLAVSATWTHGLISQSVRASERNSVVVGLNPKITLRSTIYSYFKESFSGEYHV